MTERLEQRYCIKFCQKLGDSQVETIRKIQTAFGDDAMGITQIKEWYNRFKDGRTLVKSESRSGRPSTCRNDQGIAKVNAEVMRDRRVTIREIAEVEGISAFSAHSIIIEDLTMKDNNCRYNDYINKLQEPSDCYGRKFGELQVNINENKIQSNIKKEGIIDSNIEELEAAENLVENVVYIKEEFSIPEESIDPFYQPIVKDELEFNNGQDCEFNINCVDQITKDKTHSSEQEVSEDICQATDLKCAVCNDLFVEKSHLQKHMMMVHTRVKEKKCLICGNIFTQGPSLLRHMKAHAGIKDYKCAVCNKPFVIKSNLKIHMKIHTGVKEYKCSICNKTFRQSAHLKTHMKIHTG